MTEQTFPAIIIDAHETGLIAVYAQRRANASPSLTLMDDLEDARRTGAMMARLTGWNLDDRTIDPSEASQ